MKTSTALLLLAQVLACVIGLALAKAWLPDLRLAWTEQRAWHAPAMWVALGATFYAASFALWMVVLEKTDLSIAYPLSVGATMIGTAVLAHVVFGESVTLMRAAGMTIVALGCAMIVRG